MAKLKLDLSHTLEPLETDLQWVLEDLSPEKNENAPLFSKAIEAFVDKYGQAPSFETLEELLEATSTGCTSYSQEEARTELSLEEALKTFL